MQRQEQRLSQREEQFERKLENLEKRDKALVQQEQELQAIRSEAERLGQERRGELERIAGLSADEARVELVASIEAEALREAAARVREIESQTKEEAGRRSRWIVAQAIQRCAAETTVATQCSVAIPNDEMKGRIIGKEGRNIRALEQATGVDLIIDDTPEAVVLSRSTRCAGEVARVSLLKLIADGRFHPHADRGGGGAGQGGGGPAAAGGGERKPPTRPACTGCPRS